MPKFFVTEKQVKDKKIEIIGQDVKHIRNVLRKAIGDEIIICNATSGKDYLCVIDSFEESKINCTIKNELETTTESNVKVTIMQGLPKADKMELIIQKSVELGVHEIIPIEMKRCIVKLNGKDANKKIDRWQKISEVAAKQCGRNIIPKIKSLINVKNICNLLEEYDIVLVAYENEKEITIKEELKKLKEKYKNEEIKIAIIIGPEGGIDEEEVNLLTRKWCKSNNIREKNSKNRNSSIECFKCNNVRTGELGGKNENNIKKCIKSNWNYMLFFDSSLCNYKNECG